MKKSKSISHVMTSDVTTVQQGEPVSSVRKIFESQNLHHVPIVDGDKLVGIISWNDILRISFGDFGNQDARSLDAVLDHTYKLTDVMTASPTTLSLTGTVREAAKILGSQSFHSLPVVDGKKLVGIVTSTDLIRFLSDH